MTKVVDYVKNVVLAVLTERIARWAVDQYVMPWVERIPTKRRKPFGFGG